ncbi:MAG TPA: hypothetical protein PLK76_02305 [bacterium]|nr:hypothetical protein [bacterium]
MIEWSRYHNLETWIAKVLSEMEYRQYQAGRDDEIIVCRTMEAAQQVADAANMISSCDWAPNQSPEERSENSDLANQNRRLLAYASTHQPFKGLGKGWIIYFFHGEEIDSLVGKIREFNELSKKIKGYFSEVKLSDDDLDGGHIDCPLSQYHWDLTRFIWGQEQADRDKYDRWHCHICGEIHGI